jgi:dihydropteroate synthase
MENEKREVRRQTPDSHGQSVNSGTVFESIEMIFRARQFEYSFPRPTLLMGILNVTPDSFSDGGRFTTVDAATDHALKLIEQGADILDIGGESTRPGAAPVDVEEEMRRVIPVIEKLNARISIPISIDTMKPAVARAAIGAGASIVNDVAANRSDDEMWRIVAETGAGYVLMHMQGTPQTMQENPVYNDVVVEVNSFFKEKLTTVTAAGVEENQILLDVGIGFGKRQQHTLDLLARLRDFKSWQRPLLLGVSRKSFIGQLAETKAAERVPGSIACACWAIQNGVQIIRTHDVAQTRQAMRVMEAILGRT